jgi:hypothetical protein
MQPNTRLHVSALRMQVISLSTSHARQSSHRDNLERRSKYFTGMPFKVFSGMPFKVFYSSHGDSSGAHHQPTGLVSRRQLAMISPETNIQIIKTLMLMSSK